MGQPSEFPFMERNGRKIKSLGSSGPECFLAFVVTLQGNVVWSPHEDEMEEHPRINVKPFMKSQYNGMYDPMDPSPALHSLHTIAESATKL